MGTAKHNAIRWQSNSKTSVFTGSHAVILFALDGPQKCSGLEMARYDSAKIQQELGAEFQLVQELDEVHKTPWDSEQKFQYFRFVRVT